MSKSIVWGVTIAGMTASFGIGNALGQLQRTQLERLTGQPAALVTPLKERIDAYDKVPPGWSPTLVMPPAGYERPVEYQKVVLHYEPGGLLHEHWLRFEAMAARRQQVEVRGVCASACTVVVAVVPREYLCFGPNASLNFHHASSTTGPNAGKPNPEATQRLFERYPRDIQAWINAQGGVARMPEGWSFWGLHAKELWAMGYRKCDD